MSAFQLSAVISALRNGQRRNSNTKQHNAVHRYVLTGPGKFPCLQRKCSSFVTSLVWIDEMVSDELGRHQKGYQLGDIHTWPEERGFRFYLLSVSTGCLISWSIREAQTQMCLWDGLKRDYSPK